MGSFWGVLGVFLVSLLGSFWGAWESFGRHFDTSGAFRRVSWLLKSRSAHSYVLLDAGSPQEHPWTLLGLPGRLLGPH